VDYRRQFANYFGTPLRFIVIASYGLFNKSKQHERHSMIGFAEVYAALTAGMRVRRERWDRNSVLFINNGQLIWQCHGKGTPHQLDWNDLSAMDWSIL